MKGYIIARIAVTNPEGYAHYVARTPQIASQFGGAFIVRAGRMEQMEGQGPDRHVIIEFPSYDAARRFYMSQEYQAILPIALENSNRDLVIVEGAD